MNGGPPRKVLLAGGIAAIVVLALIPVQMSVFALAWPPPDSAEAYFQLLDDRPLVGLLSLDVLLMVDFLVLLVLWGGLYAALRPHGAVLMRLALALVLVSTVMYFVSNTAFEMFSLSARYADSASAVERDALLASGVTALARFEGPWFVASYVLNGIAALLASLVMWRTPTFGKLVGGVGIVYGVLQLVPPTLGVVGMIVSVVSLVPMVVWLALLARKLLKLRSGSVAARGGTGAAPLA